MQIFLFGCKTMRCLFTAKFFSLMFRQRNNVITKPCIPVRYQSQTPVPITKSKVTKYITLRTVDGSSSSKKNSLVVIFPWLYAQPKAVDKYCNLYHSIGLDVIAIDGKVVHFLWPPTGYHLADDLLQYLLERKENYFIHSFSVGAYIFTLMLMRAHDDPGKYGMFRERILGQIFDSLTLGSYDNMSSGLVYLLPGNATMKKPILELMDVYYSITKRTTRDEYDRLVEHFKSNPILVPTLLYYSKDDPMCNVAAMEAMVDKWQTEFQNFDVMNMSWDSSVHTAHLKFHEEEYLKSWNTLLNKVNLR